MGKPITPDELSALRRQGTLGGKALRLIEADTLAYLAGEIATLRQLCLRLIPTNWEEDADASEAVGHLAQAGVVEAQTMLARLTSLHLEPAATTPSTPPPRCSFQPLPVPTIYELKDAALRLLDRKTPKTSQQLAVELGSPDRVDLLAALSQLCAEGMAIREPGTGVYLARTNPCD